MRRQDEAEVFSTEAQLESQMRDIIAQGKTLNDAIQEMFERGFGLLLLIKPIVAIAEVDSHTAMKMVLEQTREQRYKEYFS